MTRFLVMRLVTLALTLLVVSFIVFWTMNALPGDPALVILGMDSTEDARAALSRELGLEAPFFERYFGWLVGVLQGDFGTSFSFGVPVADLIVERLPVTVPLALLATTFTVAFALMLGVYAASRHGHAGDVGVMTLSQLGIAIPAFWLAILLVILFSVYLRWLPSGGFPGWSNPATAFAALVLPTVALALVQSAVLARVTRSSVLEVMRLDYATTARAKGLSRGAMLRRHVLPNALIPIITVIGMQFAGVVTGTIVIENVFYLPGLGRLIFQSITNRDLFVVQSLVLFFAATVVIVNFIVDVLYAVIDPRLRDRVRREGP
ncbi:ABC transporter permease [Minwuia sp.]|uniref:ABC transporter permease n=1 Tax=Minwuia sp. TaxID=2493630 RepID=UPI003A9576E5